MLTEAHYPQHFSYAMAEWQTVSDWLAGWCGLPANRWSSVTRFPRLNNVVDYSLDWLRLSCTVKRLVSCISWKYFCAFIISVDDQACVKFFAGKCRSITVLVMNILRNDGAVDDHFLKSFHENYIYVGYRTECNIYLTEMQAHLIKAQYPQRFSNSENAWRTISHCLAGWCGGCQVIG